MKYEIDQTIKIDGIDLVIVGKGEIKDEAILIVKNPNTNVEMIKRVKELEESQAMDELETLLAESKTLRATTVIANLPKPKAQVQKIQEPVEKFIPRENAYLNATSYETLNLNNKAQKAKVFKKNENKRIKKTLEIRNSIKPLNTPLKSEKESNLETKFVIGVVPNYLRYEKPVYKELIIPENTEVDNLDFLNDVVEPDSITKHLVENENSETHINHDIMVNSSVDSNKNDILVIEDNNCGHNHQVEILNKEEFYKSFAHEQKLKNFKIGKKNSISGRISKNVEYNQAQKSVTISASNDVEKVKFLKLAHYLNLKNKLNKITLTISLILIITIFAFLAIKTANYIVEVGEFKIEALLGIHGNFSLDFNSLNTMILKIDVITNVVFLATLFISLFTLFLSITIIRLKLRKDKNGFEDLNQIIE